MQLLSKLKSRVLLCLFPLLAGGIYLLRPEPPVSCKSFQRFGAIEQEGRCIIKRNVTIQGNIKQLPDRLTIQGNLTISGTYITELPAEMIVERDLFGVA